MKKTKISRAEASGKYGCKVSDDASTKMFFLREDGVVVDETGKIRYLPNGYVVYRDDRTGETALDADGDIIVKSILDSSITVLDPTVRTLNCLWRAGINTVSDLCALTEDDLRRVRNLGAKCVQEIKDKLAVHGLALGYKDIIQDEYLHNDDKQPTIQMIEELKHKGRNRIYALLGADNLGCDITCQLCATYSEAYSCMEKAYNEILEEENPDRIEYKEISKFSAEIMTTNNDIFYWNIKEVEI